MNILLSFLIWAGIMILTVALFLVDLVLAGLLFPFDKQRRLCHVQCFWWADALIGMNPWWQINARGLENIDPDRTYVVVANHQSMADIIALYKTRMQFKWVAKESLFGIPVLGWTMSLNRHICLSRGEFGSIKKIYRDAASWLRGGMSVVFFPEGTRSETDEMNPFLNGSFKLAIKEKVPVLPIAINGTRDAIPKGSWIFSSKVRGTITVLPPVETEGLGPGDFRELNAEVRRRIIAAIN